MALIRGIQKGIYKKIKIIRLREVEKLLDRKKRKLLDIGCQDLRFYNKLKKNFDITLADYEPKNKHIRHEDIQKLSFKDKEFDTVLCLEVLEHTFDPVKAIRELKRVTNGDLIISVPNEPFFTLWRGMHWEDEHLWAITSKVLKHYLGKPKKEKTFFFKRYYMAKWSFD